MANGNKKERTSGRKGKRLSPFAFRLWKEWKCLNLPFEDTRVVVAVSGGADSVALFLALHELLIEEKLSLDLTVAHFNHGLRDEAKEDAEWVKTLITNYELRFTNQESKIQNPKSKIEFVLGAGNVLSQAEQNKDNLEQAARKARYDFLFDVALKKNASIIVTAHTMDDQAETVLLRLLRGSGTEGLGGIKSVSQFKVQNSKFKIQGQESEGQTTKYEGQKLKDSGQRTADSGQQTENQKSNNLKSKIQNPKSKEVLLVRPLLTWVRRVGTENFCRDRGIDFRLDVMNEDLNFARVRVRKELLPMMRTFNERIVESLSRTAEILREDDKELDLQAEKLLIEASVDDEGVKPFIAPLKVDVMSRASVSLRRRVLRMWIEKGKGDLRRVEMAHILQVEKLFEGTQGGRIVEIPKGYFVERRKGLILFHSQKA